MKDILKSRPGILPGIWVWFIKKSHIPPVIMSSGFYVYHSWHLPFFLMILLLLPVVLINYAFARLALAAIRARFRKEKLNLWPELLVALCLLVLLYFTDLKDKALWMVLIPVLYYFWLFLLSWLKHLGSFYTGFAGLILFTMIVSSYRLLHGEERLVLLLHYYWNRIQNLDVIQDELHWEESQREAKLYRLTRREKMQMELEIPARMFFRDSRLIRFKYELPEPGIPLAFISSNQFDMLAPPSMGVFMVEGHAQRTLWDLRDQVAMILGHRSNAAEISEIKFEGNIKLDPPLSSVKLRGLAWSYNDFTFARNIRMAIYFSPEVVATRYVFVLYDPIVEGFRHHPDLLFILRSIKIFGRRSKE